MVEQYIYIMQYYSIEESNAPHSPIFQTAYETNAHELFMWVCVIALIGWNSGFCNDVYLIKWNIYVPNTYPYYEIMIKIPF